MKTLDDLKIQTPQQLAEEMRSRGVTHVVVYDGQPNVRETEAMLRHKASAGLPRDMRWGDGHIVPVENLLAQRVELSPITGEPLTPTTRKLWESVDREWRRTFSWAKSHNKLPSGYDDADAIDDINDGGSKIMRWHETVKALSTEERERIEADLVHEWRPPPPVTIPGQRGGGDIVFNGPVVVTGGQIGTGVQVTGKTPFAALVDLLLSCFDADGMRRLVRWHLGSHAAADLPGSGVTSRHLATEIADLVRRRGTVESLFDGIRQERANRIREIDAVARMWDC